ncbi:MAG: PKD domain-containing protein [Ignavibacteria bacterium]|nr:PKD domain-containing protein [Ignavibacteria bacterium]
MLVAFALWTNTDFWAQSFAFNHWWIVANGITVGWNAPTYDRSYYLSVASEGWWGTAKYSAYKNGAAMCWLGPYNETGLIADAQGVRSLSDPKSTDTSKFYVPYFWQGSRRRNTGYDDPLNYPSGMSQVALFPMPGNSRLLYFATPKSYSDSASYGGYINRSLSILDLDSRTVKSVDSVLQPLFDIDPALEIPTELVSACADPLRGVTWLVFVNKPTSGSANIIFYALRIENDTIHKPVRSEVSGRTDLRGKLTFSTSGDMAAIGSSIYRFHHGSGTFNVHCTLSGSSLSNSPAFSPRGRYVWVPGYKRDTMGDSSSVLYQYDMRHQGPMLTPVATLDMGQMRWHDAGGYVAHALSPDCKLYFAMESMVFALKHPDELGIQTDTLLSGRDHLWSSINGMPSRFMNFHGMPDLVNQLTFSLDSTSCLWPKASFVVDTVCLGECVTMDSVFYAGVEKWRWTFEGGTPRTSDNKKAPCVTFNSPGLHKVTLIYSNGVAVDTVERYANVLPPPDVDVGPDLSVCLGDTVLLTATGATKYRWFPTIGLSDPDSASTRLVPTANKSIYVVRGIDSNGCEGLDTIVITRGALNAQINGVRDLYGDNQ